MHLEIVSHCWRYSRLLTYQLSSLALFPPQQTSVTLTVFFAPEDRRTLRVLEYFGGLNRTNVVWRWWGLERGQLLQRAVGRNLAARHTQADWVWFADCDMCFREDCLDRLPAAIAEFPDPDGARLVHPRQVQVSRDHATGDACIARAGFQPRILDVDPDEFVGMRYRRAIGGAQIAPGALLRESGYCPGSRFQRPADRWQPCRSDRVFRRQIGAQGTAIDLPHVYRIRHSQRGRSAEGLRL